MPLSSCLLTEPTHPEQPPVEKGEHYEIIAIFLIALFIPAFSPHNKDSPALEPRVQVVHLTAILIAFSFFFLFFFFNPGSTIANFPLIMIY